MDELVETPGSPVPHVTKSRPPWAYSVLGILLVAVIVGGYWVKTRPVPGVPGSASSGNIETVMNAGLDALYKRNDPDRAAIEFRKVLVHNSTHYGATYQLAVALDRGGKRAEARPLWEKVVTMAEGFKDQPTLNTARTRLAQK